MPMPMPMLLPIYLSINQSHRLHRLITSLNQPTQPKPPSRNSHPTNQSQPKTTTTKTKTKTKTLAKQTSSNLIFLSPLTLPFNLSLSPGELNISLSLK
ncbi:hypothetical protein DM02DRAFT_219600 [Periconia macrospinosa]|uniref:Uncharacterized protein n=1 Tax=Periconia macrospinosa TaxID=97972 RepID=A0A2V1DZT5_9PLEO|nr:hypothetical protein DM02DRAFT_219600 [Periconia macrospinosa]